MKKQLILLVLCISINVFAGADFITNSFSHKISTVSVRSYNGIERCFVETTSFGNGAVALFFNLDTPASAIMYSQIRDAKKDGSTLILIYKAGSGVSTWAPQNAVWTNDNAVSTIPEIVAIMVP